MAKIAARFGRADGEAKPPRFRELASGHGWSLSDVVCEAGPANRPFEEQHTCRTVAIVLGGSFQYRSSTGCELMTPGSLLLGNAGDSFCCGHEHAAGDRCVSFTFTPEFLDRVGAPATARLDIPRVPPVRATSPLVVRTLTFLAGDRSGSGEELSVRVAAEVAAIVLDRDRRDVAAEAGALSRVTRVVRMIENDADKPQSLDALARIAGLSPYHFLRIFEGVTGTTPHQYVLRTRLRQAAIRLKTDDAKVLDVALECGFGDVSNFNRAFRAEFGMSPSRYRSSL